MNTFQNLFLENEKTNMIIPLKDKVTDSGLAVFINCLVRKRIWFSSKLHFT